MQKIATRIFICASLAFGVLGILIVLFELDKDNKSELDILLMKSFMITVFIILPSFALSVAGKYLNGNKQ
jgi:cadmium resistance protein CadD (predicted permease)